MTAREPTMPVPEPATPATPSTVRLHRFAILSGIGWLLDFGLFNLLAWSGSDLFVANVAGATLGVSWVFLTARAFIFQSRRTSLAAAVAGYVVWNVVAILAASAAVDLLGGWLESWLGAMRWIPAASAMLRERGLAVDAAALAAPLAKAAVTPFTMYANYVMMGVIAERRLQFR
jgi:putative flippase GtrA